MIVQMIVFFDNDSVIATNVIISLLNVEQKQHVIKPKQMRCTTFPLFHCYSTWIQRSTECTRHKTNTGLISYGYRV